MAYLTSDSAAKREIAIPTVTTLQSLRGIIQGTFEFVDEGAFSYEVLGCAAPGYRVKLRDLILSGVTQFRYLQDGSPKQIVEIAIVPPPQAARLETGESSKACRGPAGPRDI
jgi:hypothetical protein